MSKRVLYFDISGQGGGSNISLRTLVDALDEQRYTAVLAFGNQPNKKVWGNRTTHSTNMAGLDNYDFFPACWSLPWIYHFLRWLIHIPWDLIQSFCLLHRVRPDIVHVNVGQAVIFGIAAKLAGYPVIWHLRELVCRNKIGQFQVSIYKKCSRHIVAISAAVARRIENSHIVHVLSNPVEIAPVIANPDSSPSQKPANLHVLLLGKPSRVKGFEFLALVAEKLKHRRDIIFLLGGDFSDPPAGLIHRIFRNIYRTCKSTPGEREELRKTWMPIIEEQRAHILGHVNPEQAIARCDLVVCPNTVTEPFGRTVIEAYALGRPVIATRIEAFDETVEHGHSGWLLPLDAGKWAVQLEHLADHRNELDDMKPHVLELAQHYAATRHAGAMMNLYDSLLSDNTTGPIPS